MAFCHHNHHHTPGCVGIVADTGEMVHLYRCHSGSMSFTNICSWEQNWGLHMCCRCPYPRSEVEGQ